MAVQKVEAWKADDGSLFETIAGAEMHNASIKHEKLMHKVDLVVGEAIDEYCHDLDLCQVAKSVRVALDAKFIIEER